ncbi:MAG: Gfo/Idh/MocA family oxidoreductase [Verrucomicrobiae bacterium]|nr:Gfo/Idh/MocA family oxidoreductase [Verrucomicrobiae bacterium]
MNDSDSPTCRWGILGAATIARKNWLAILNSGNGIVKAVASRDAARAQQWIDENQAQHPFSVAPEAVAGYETMLARNDIDAVYIPLPTGVRKDWVIAAARAGKHVLCEKPCGSTAADVEEMIAACRDAGVQFMDGVMFMHSDRLPALRDVLDDGKTVGTIKRIASQFSFFAPEDFLAGGNIRVDASLEPLGSLGDLGWYTIRFSQWVMNWERPSAVTGRIIAQTETGVPIEFSGELLYPSGPTASFYCSFLTEHQQWANVSGTLGNVDMRDFVLPYYDSELAFIASNAHFETDVCDFRMERHDTRHAVSEYSSSHVNAQETKLFRTFAKLALGNSPDDHWPRIALQTQQILDACLESARNQSREVSLG